MKRLAWGESTEQASACWSHGDGRRGRMQVGGGCSSAGFDFSFDSSFGCFGRGMSMGCRRPQGPAGPRKPPRPSPSCGAAPWAGWAGREPPAGPRKPPGPPALPPLLLWCAQEGRPGPGPRSGCRGPEKSSARRAGGRFSAEDLAGSRGRGVFPVHPSVRAAVSAPEAGRIRPPADLRLGS